MSTEKSVLRLGSLFLSTYRIVAELGAGSYGSVYHGRHVTTGRDVALKLLRLHGAASTPDHVAVAERFRREMRINAQLWHPNIARLHDWGEADDTLYAVFDLIPGTTLREVLRKEGRLAMAEAVHLLRQVLDALSCAHTRHIVHRDLKPENIMVTRTGAQRNAVVVDFGAGHLGDEPASEGDGGAPTRELIGSPCYAAPEQLHGAAPMPSSDLYAWGLIFIECVTGAAAVDGATAEEVVLKQLSAEPIVLPSWLMQHSLGPLLRAATAKDPARRAMTADALLTALATAEAVVAEPTSPRYGVAPEEGERRQLTVVSCRFSLCGESVREAEEVDLLLHDQQSRCADLAMRHGGQLAGVMADRVMLTFGYPHAREDDARRAVRTALQIIDQLGASADGRLAVHVGVHTGIVMVRAAQPAGRHKLPHLLGLTPRIALGLDALAAAGEVLLSADTVLLLRGRVETEPTGAVVSVEGAAPRSVLRLQPTLPRSERLAPPAETPFIGRGRQLDTLVDAWTRAAAGRPVALLIQGEPGIGKSRLVRELRRHVPLEGWLESRCLPESQATPLAPLIDQLNLLGEPLDTVLERYGFVLEETVPLLATLLSRPPDSRYPGQALSAERRKELTLALLRDLLLRMAETAPTAFVLEDLQWADPTTLELVDQVVSAVRERRDGSATKLGVILTARPDFAPPWPSDDVASVSLGGLSEREVASMIKAAVARDGTVPPAVVEEVVRRADGVPLFVEEVTRVLAESGWLSSGDATRAPVQIPVTLRDLLMQRLDGLSPPARQTAQLAGVLGREFRFAVLQAVSTIGATELREHLSELEIAGLIAPRRGTHAETYLFRHALLRDAAYDSLVRAVRQPLHHRVATTLRDRFPEIEHQRPETLALHFEHGGEHDTAIDYWHRAGSRALHRASYQEALTLLQRGLGLITNGAATPEQGRRRVQLLSTLGTVLISTKGYSTIEVEQTFERAWTLCGDIDGEIPNDVLYGLWGVHITRSDPTGTDALIPIFQRIIARTDDPVSVLTASACLGTACYWRAQFDVAERHFLHARRLFDTDQFQRFAQTFGYGVGLYSHAFGQLTLWLLGYPDQAERVRQELLEIAARVRDPYCSAVALGFAMTLAHDRDDPAIELDYADRLAQLALEQRLPVWVGISQIGRGGAFARLGGAAEAIAPLQEGLQMLRQVGIMCSYNYFLPYLAQAYLNAGRFDDALATLAESTELCGTLVARLHEPELLRLRGAVVLHRDGTGSESEVEGWYQRARALARANGARSYELRIGLGLAELWLALGRQREARALLAEVDDWFSEGRNTPDRRAAAALRQELCGT